MQPIEILVSLCVFFILLLFVCISGYCLEYILNFNITILKSEKVMSVIINDFLVSVLIVIMILIV